MSRHLDTSTQTQMSKSMVRTVILLQDFCGKGNSRKFFSKTDGKKFQIGNCYSWTGMWTISKCQERNRFWIQCGKHSWTKLIWKNQHHSLTMFIWVALNESVKISKDIVDNNIDLFQSRMSAGGVKIALFRNIRSKHFILVLWYGRSCKEMRGKILRTCDQNNSTVLQSRNKVATPEAERTKWPHNLHNSSEVVPHLDKVYSCERGHLGNVYDYHSSKLKMLIRQPGKRTILICVCGRYKTGWKETEHWSDLENSHARRWFGRTNIISWPCFLGCTQRECPISKDIVDIFWSMFESRIFCWCYVKVTRSWSSREIWDTPSHHGRMIWKVMQRNVWEDVANWRIKQRNNYTKSRRHAWMTISSEKKKMDLLENDLLLAHRNFWNVCIWLVLVGPDILWSVNKLARAVTKWTKACDKRAARLISYIHHTSEFRQYCHVGNTALQCRLGLFQDSDFAGDLEDSKSTSGGILCTFGSRTFVPTSWMCKKQTSVAHSSTEAEVISLDACLGMDGIPAHLVIEVFHSSPNQTNKTKDVREPWGSKHSTTHKTNSNHLDLTNIDHVPSNGTHSGFNALLYVFEDNEAVIKMKIKGRGPTMRHVSRTHRVALDWLLDRINLDSKIQILHMFRQVLHPQKVRLHPKVWVMHLIIWKRWRFQLAFRMQKILPMHSSGETWCKNTNETSNNCPKTRNYPNLLWSRFEVCPRRTTLAGDATFTPRIHDASKRRGDSKKMMDLHKSLPSWRPIHYWSSSQVSVSRQNRFLG